jgi:hypothetical protein
MATITGLIGADWRRRPWWMSLLFYFCCYMAFIYMPFDLFFKPVAQDHEIWFGFSLTGWWAKATEPVHWFVYGAGVYGFRHMRSWMWPWTAIYAAQVFIAMIVWNLVNTEGGGIVASIVAGAISALPMIALWRAKNLFQCAMGRSHDPRLSR